MVQPTFHRHTRQIRGHWSPSGAVGVQSAGTEGCPAIPALMELLQDPDARELQFDIVGVLGWIGPDSLPPMIQSLSTCDAATKFNILFGLGQFRSNAPVVVPVLLTSLRDRSPNCRTVAAVSLGRMAQNEELCVPALTNLLTDPDSQTRWAACTALAEFKERAKPGIPALLSTLHDGDPAVKGMAAIALAKIDPENVARRQDLMPILIHNLEGVAGAKLDSLRYSTMEVIGPWGEQAKAAVPALLECLGDQTAYVRESAGNTLRQIDPASAVEAGIK